MYPPPARSFRVNPLRSEASIIIVVRGEFSTGSAYRLRRQSRFRRSTFPHTEDDVSLGSGCAITPSNASGRTKAQHTIRLGFEGCTEEAPQNFLLCSAQEALFLDFADSARILT